jgi:hypothetical protein
MANEREQDDAGFGRPPKHARFKKGTSGNPRGRPKQVANFKADLAAELQEKLVLTENGKQRRVSKQRAFVKTLVAAAIKKDIRAVNALLACMRYFGVGSEELTIETADASDLDLLETYLAQRRKKQKRDADSPTGETLKSPGKKR